MGRTDFLLLGRSYEKGTEGEVTLLCHVTQRRTGTGSPLLAEGHNCLQKPQTDNVLTPILMLSSNSDENHVDTSLIHNDTAASICPTDLHTLSQMVGVTQVNKLHDRIILL